MSFLENLLQFPLEWQGQWVVVDDEVIFQEQADNNQRFLESLSQSIHNMSQEGGTSFDPEMLKHMLNVDNLDLDNATPSEILKLIEKASRSTYGANDSMLAGMSKGFSFPEVGGMSQVVAPESAPEVEDEASTPEDANGVELEEAQDQADSETPEAEPKDTNEDHGQGHQEGGHKHKKHPEEMTAIELSAIATSCNAKTLAFIVKRGGESALIKGLSNQAMEADWVVKIIKTRSPSSTLLTTVGRLPRFNRNPEVIMALCMNPKTPVHLTRALIGRVPESGLKEISRSAGLPRALKAMARNKLERKKKKK